MSAPTPSTVTSNKALSATSLNIDHPSGDNIYIAFISYESLNNTASTVSTPTGWTHIVTVTNTVGGTRFINQSAFWRAAGGTNTSWGFNKNVACEGVIIPIQGASVSSPTPIADSDTATATNTDTHVAAAGTTALANSLVIYGFSGGRTVSPVTFGEPSGISDFIYSSDGSGLTGLPTVIASKAVASASASTGTATSISISDAPVSSAMITLVVNASQLPTAPVITSPVAGVQITKGVSYSLTANPASSPVVAQPDLRYQWRYSSNGLGGTFTDIGSLTSAGVTSATWTTSSLTPGTNYYLQAVAWDGTSFGPTHTVGPVTVLADVAPGKPTNLSPNATTVDRAAGLTISWTFNDPGDVQSERTWEWGTDGVTFGTVSTVSTSATSIPVTGGAGILATRGQKYHRVKVEDNAGNASAYSDTATFFAGDKPATPVITSPLSGSPPTSPTHTIAWTSVGQTQYRLRFEMDGVQIHDTGWVVSTATSVASPYPFANGVTYTLYISIKNSDGLASDEDSETFTASYSGPDAPTVVVAANDDTGGVSITVGNTGSVDHNDIERLEEGESEYIRVAKNVAVNGTFQDYNLKSGVTYYYRALAYDSTGLFTPSPVSDGVSLTLSKLMIHPVTKTSTTTNASLAPVPLSNRPGGTSFSEAHEGTTHRPRGRGKSIKVFGQIKKQILRASIRIDSEAILARLKAAYDANVTICVRDQSTSYKAGNRIFGKLVTLPKQRFTTLTDVEIEVMEDDYSEEV